MVNRIDRLLSARNWVLLVFLFISGLPIHAVEFSDDYVSLIDNCVEEQLGEVGLIRNPLTTDEEYVRRVYLDVIGRIPTYAEVTRFLASNSKTKREELIDQLLGSEGYVSNFYNYWADLLRVQSRNRKSVMVAYQDWIKESLRSNKPYDELVKEIITAEGFVWEDPAVGYYVRDAGMELDNMSNTMQVFLGTRMQCAQCHDHPFDKWTQKDFYHVASYSYGTETKQRLSKLDSYRTFQQTIRKEIKRANGSSSKRVKIDPVQRRAMRDLFEPFEQEIQTTGRVLKLPEDYQYENGKPLDGVEPKVPFGEDANIERREDPRLALADWMTSPHNPRFATVVANRLWKKLLGVGLFEPVDDLRDDSEVSNPELMKALSELMVRCDFDLKQYMRVLLNTRTYQSQSSVEEWNPEMVYLYQGPLLRRMTAEQVWDSVLTLSINDVDSRVGDDNATANLRKRGEAAQKQVENVEKLKTKQLTDLVKVMGESRKDYIAKERAYSKELDQAASAKEKKRIKREFATYRRSREERMGAMIDDMAGSNGENMEMSSSSDDAVGSKTKNRKNGRYMNTLVRASSVVSPAPAGHFLDRFGQSDRELTDSSIAEASIPQVLELMNGQAPKLVLNTRSPLVRRLKSVQDSKDRENVLFRSLYGRIPSEEDRELIRQKVELYGAEDGMKMVIVALLNTQEFIFIQ